MEITVNKLHRMRHRDGLILQGCGSDIQEWVDRINKRLAQEDILLEGTKFGSVRSFSYEGLTNLLFPFEDAKLNFGRLAIRRFYNHETHGGIRFSNYAPNRLGGLLDEGSARKTEERQQSEFYQGISAQESEEIGLGDISMR